MTAPRPVAVPSSLPSIQALLDAGADPTLKDDSGQTAMDRARQSNSREMMNAIEAAVNRWRRPS